jgi:DNA-binding NarL/FixJ family response regulator
MIRVLIVDDHEIVRHGLRDLLVSRLEAVHVGEARDATEAIQQLTRQPWDLVLLDINLPGRNGLEVLTEARRLTPKTPVLVLTSYSEEQFALHALKLGACGYITKNEATEQLITAVQRLLAGGKYITSSLAESLADHVGAPDLQAPHEALSQRELQVLCAIATGKSIKDIATQLSLSEKTIATYRTRITEKTGLRSNVDIARFALKQGLVD